MKRIIFMDCLDHGIGRNLALAALRITACVVIFPHGAQLLLGVFGGGGFDHSMYYFTTTAQLPWVVGFLVIVIQYFGSLLLLLGLLTRLNALVMLILFVGMIFTSHLEYGFFMNWFGNQKGEGFEYHVLVLGIMTALVLQGGGKWSLDMILTYEE